MSKPPSVDQTLTKAPSENSLNIPAKAPLEEYILSKSDAERALTATLQLNFDAAEDSPSECTSDAMGPVSNPADQSELSGGVAGADASRKTKPTYKKTYRCMKCSFTTTKSKLHLYHQIVIHKENANIFSCIR